MDFWCMETIKYSSPIELLTSESENRCYSSTRGVVRSGGFGLFILVASFLLWKQSRDSMWKIGHNKKEGVLLRKIFSTDLCMGQEMDNRPLLGKDFINEKLFAFTVNIIAEGWRKATVYPICCIISQLYTRDLKNCDGNAGL